MSVIDTTNIIVGNSATQSQNLKITGNADGTFTIARADASQTLMTIDAAGLVTMTQGSGRFILGTAQATTSGTSIDFTGIPSWVKKITVMLTGVSTNGSSALLLQLGSGSVEVTGYQAGDNTNQYTTGFGFYVVGASYNFQGAYVFSKLQNDTWIGSGNIVNQVSSVQTLAGTKTLAGTLDRIRLTTVNGTDTFDAGSVNIMYEG